MIYLEDPFPSGPEMVLMHRSLAGIHAALWLVSTFQKTVVLSLK